MNDEIPPELQAIAYPEPLEPDRVDRIVQARIEMGWKYPVGMTAEERATMRLSIARNARMGRWLRKLGLTPGEGLHPKHPHYQPPPWMPGRG